MTDRQLIKHLFSNSTIHEVLYDLISTHLSSEQLQQLIIQTQRCMQWNYLPNDLWLLCWNYTTQMEYRCGAIHLNRQCWKLSQDQARYCRARTHVTLNEHVKTPERILFNLQQPIVSLSVTAACLLKHQPLPHVQSLHIISGVLPIQILARLFKHLSKLRQLSWFVDVHQDLTKEVSESLVHLQELELQGLNQNRLRDRWIYTLLPFLLNLQILRLNHLWHSDLQVLQGVTIHLRELYLNECTLQSINDSSHILRRFPNLQVLELYNVRSLHWHQPVPCLQAQNVLNAIMEFHTLHRLKLSYWTLNDLQQFATPSSLTRSLQTLYITIQLDLQTPVSYSSLYSALVVLINTCTQLHTFHLGLPDHTCALQITETPPLIICNNHPFLAQVHLIFGTRIMKQINAHFIWMFASCSNLQQLEIQFESEEELLRPCWWNKEIQDCFIAKRQAMDENDVYGGVFINDTSRVQYFDLLKHVQSLCY